VLPFSRTFVFNLQSLTYPCDELVCSSNSAGKLVLSVQLDSGLHFTEGADSRFRLIGIKKSAATGSTAEDPSVQTVLAAGALQEGCAATIPYQIPAEYDRLELEARTYYCDVVDNACRSDNALFVLPVVPDGTPRDHVLVEHIYAPSSDVRPT